MGNKNFKGSFTFNRKERNSFNIWSDVMDALNNNNTNVWNVNNTVQEQQM